MSFGSGSGFSFGSNTNSANTGFGGFGNNTTTNTGFGSTSNTGFGSSTAASNPFGGSTFGSNTGGFGNNNNASGSLFGNKPAASPFGSSTTNTGGGLFGGAANTNTGFGSSTGGFGSTNSAFGGANAGNSTFSFGNANKPAFGSTTNTTPLFGQGGSGTTGTFGGSTAFGSAGTGTALSSQPVPPSDGTASTPFAPTLEKDAAGSSSNYQSISFMPPYQKYSFEELRLADYNAGRRFGTSTGQAGGFGSSTFGGFGSTNTTAFGSNASNPTPNSNPFGTATTSSTGFGTTSTTTGFGGGGLFGNKPAAGGLFGQQSSGASSGGLFGTANNTSSGFGGGNTGFSSGGGLFGSNNANQNKSSPFGATSSTPSFSFGNNNNNNNTPSAGTGTGLFGNNTNTSTSAFGGNNQPAGGLFGNQQKSLFGNTTGGFGTSTSQSQPSGGLFGNSGNTGAGASGGGLFGNTNTTTTNNNTGSGGGLFGQNNATGGSLFGNNASNAQKPGGLFGGSTFGPTNTGNTSGGLFGNTGTNNQQQGGLFGNNANTNTGFSFGNTANKPATTSLFANTNTNQQGGLSGSTGNFGNLFGTSQTAQPGSLQQPEVKHASLNDPNPYGQTSIWTGLPVPTPDNSKPIFTPLSATQKLKESQSKPPPSLRLNQSRYMTPPRRSGFGFSYSTYGTPNSAASTPGGNSLTNSMYGSRSFNGGSFGRSFGKSASASNLRSQFNGDSESILSPNAFAATNTRWSSGNMRRLTIDRSIRNDLFSRPSLPALPTNSPEKIGNGSNELAAVEGEPPSEPTNKLKKRVSFDKETTGGQNGTLNANSGALVRAETGGEESDAGTRRGTLNGSATPEAEPVPRGNELAVVPEDRESDHVVSQTPATVQAKPDPQPGDYWMKPSRAELGRLPREKLQRFVGFEVGRKGCGKVVFNGPVDLTVIPLDDLFEKIVEIRLRSVTVYPDASSKPPVGKGLNVPSTISIENSWPRSRGQPSSATSGPVYEKHVNRLKKMHGTEFINYEPSTGVWTFRVPHYTRYGLDYEEEDDTELGQSQLSVPPDSLSGSQSGRGSVMDVDSEDQDDYEDGEDDTFAFKQKIIPGGFGRRSAIGYDDEIISAQTIEDEDQASESAGVSEDEASDNEVSMAGSFPPPGGALALDLQSPNKPILRASRMGTPGKALISLDGDWAEQLQRTISPRKQNRDALREVQSKVLLDRTHEPIKPAAMNKHDFRTSIDIMNSLFSRHEERMAKGSKAQAGPDLEFPYPKRAKMFDDDQIPQADQLWHSSFKPHFTPTNELTHLSKAGDESGPGHNTVVLLDNPSGSVVLTSLEGKRESNMVDVESLVGHTRITLVDQVPFATHVAVPFSQIKDRLIQQRRGSDEIDLYELAHVLFDDYEDELTVGFSRQQKQEFSDRIRKERLSRYLASLVWARHGEKIKAAVKQGAASAAILHLTAKNIKEACDVLEDEKDFHLTLLVAQIEQADDSFQDDIAGQLAAWRRQGIISEMTDEIRALYEILAGNTCISEGKQKGPVEDRTVTFAISKKFGLDWVQAFCLCLWYGRQKNGNIQEAVMDFQEKLATKQELASPVGEKGNEDPLWVLLKLFASKAKGKVPDLDDPVFPGALSALSGTWDCQKTFRLHHAIAASIPRITVDEAKADDLAMSLAFERASRGDTLGATWALLHVADSAKRQWAVRDLLTRHATALPEPPSGDQPNQSPLWTALTSSLKVPSSWICHAKALYARSLNTPLVELNLLIQADDFAEAHECLIRRVAPRLVIDEDWDTLATVLAKFGDHPETKVNTGSGADTQWPAGGGVFADFVSLMMLLDSGFGSGSGPGAGRGRSGNAETVAQRTSLLQRLQTALMGLNARLAGAAIKAHGSLDQDREKLEERVALSEMARAVARALELELEDDRNMGDKKSILDLPLTADARLAHARVLGVEYYRGVMAMAR